MVMQQRQEKIVEILKKEGGVEIAALEGKLGVSAQTVKRDLKALEDLGRLRRVRGGAVLPAQPAKPSDPAPALDWYSPARPPFTQPGFPFYEADGVYRRYPQRNDPPLPRPVDYLADNPSGGQIRFRARTANVALRVRLRTAASQSYNAIPLADSGFDLYASDGDGHYTMVGVTRFDPKMDYYEAVIGPIPLPEKPLDYILYFPIRNHVESVMVGVDKGAEVLPPLPFAEADKGKVLIYGGSIMHGYCASRPGMTMPSQLSRRLGREVFNLGVNGSARCEDEVALALRRCEGVKWLIVSPEGNCKTVEWLDEHLRSFLRLVRETHPEWIIAVMSYMREGRERFQTDYTELRRARRDCERKIVEDFRAAGDDRIVFWNGEEFTEGDEDVADGVFSMGEECTTDTQHKSDMGFFLMARAMEKRLRAYEKEHE